MNMRKYVKLLPKDDHTLHMQKLITCPQILSLLSLKKKMKHIYDP